jgi:hypothetical protein
LRARAGTALAPIRHWDDPDCAVGAGYSHQMETTDDLTFVTRDSAPFMMKSRSSTRRLLGQGPAPPDLLVRPTRLKEDAEAALEILKAHGWVETSDQQPRTIECSVGGACNEQRVGCGADQAVPLKLLIVLNRPGSWRDFSSFSKISTRPRSLHTC